MQPKETEQRSGSRDRAAGRGSGFAKHLLFSVAAVLLALGSLEGVLWLLGVERRIDREDPSYGFSGLVSVFVEDGDRYRTRESVRFSVFNDQSFAAAKPADTFRMFVLGGSSAYGFPWNAEASFSGILQDVLRESHPGRSIEVVNAGGISYAMHRVLRVARELADYEPDAFLVYSGHNEFVERYAYGAFREGDRAIEHVTFVLAHSRIYSALERLLSPSAQERERREQQRRLGMQVERDHSKRHDPAEKLEVVEDYRDGLRRLVRFARDRGIDVLLVTLPCNLRDWSPEASVAGLAEGASESDWRASYRRGRQRLAAGDAAAAVDLLERARASAPDHADSRFLLARAYEAVGRWDDARREYASACDLDATPNRRPSGVNRAIRDVAADEGVPIVDLDRAFEEESPHGLVGFNLVEDYVHPNEAGHRLIAWRIWETIERLGWIEEGRAARRDTFERVVAARGVGRRADNPTWHYNQALVLQNRGHFRQALAAYREALAIDPDYVEALNNVAQLSYRYLGQADEARRLVARILELDPDYPLARMLRGEMLAAAGRHEEAIVEYRRALAAAPDADAAHDLLGNSLARRGEIDAAIAAFERARALNPNRSRYHLNLAGGYFLRERYDEAVTSYERAARLDPDDPLPHFNLGLCFERLGRPADAAESYRRALDRDPDLKEARAALERLQDAVDRERPAGPSRLPAP